MRGFGNGGVRAAAFALAVASATTASAQAAPAGEQPAATVAPLKVVVAGSAPFVIGPEAADGLAVDIWNAAASEMGVAFELARASSAADALERVVAGTADVAVGPISITASRAQRVAFSQPFFQAHLALAARPDAGALARIKPFLTIGFVSGVAGLLVVLLAVGLLVWLAERRKNPDQFPPGLAAGIGNGIWLALVTMTTVGYGDRVPVTPAGRVVAGVWMVVSMLIAGSLIAFMSTALTLSQIGGDGINSAADLRSRRVAVVAGTTSESFARRHGARLVPVKTLDDAVSAIADERAAAIVFDGPSLSYHLQQHPDADLVLAEARYEPTGYGFAVAVGSPLQQRVSLAILELQSQGFLRQLESKWLGIR